MEKSKHGKNSSDAIVNKPVDEEVQDNTAGIDKEDAKDEQMGKSSGLSAGASKKRKLRIEEGQTISTKVDSK